MVYFLLFWVLLFIAYVILSIILKTKEIKARPDFERWVQKFDKKYCVKEDFAIQTTIAGLKHENREQTLLKSIRKGIIKEGALLLLVPDPKNLYDNTATKVYTSAGLMLGFLPNKEWNNKIFTDLQTGKRWDATVNQILTPSREFNNYNILIDLWEYTENTK